MECGLKHHICMNLTLVPSAPIAVTQMRVNVIPAVSVGCFYFFPFRWFAKRFLHPDVVSIYDYVFLWDEDLGVKHFNPGRYT